MGYPFVEYDISHLYWQPLLKADGSNFMRWYEQIRGNLKKNNILYTLEEHLEDKAGPSASQEEDDKYRDRREAFIEVQSLLTHIMEPELVERFKHFDPCDTMEVLRYDFLEEIKRIRYKYWDELLSTTMEENTCLETHLMKMLYAYEHLTEVWDDWLDDSFAIKAVLRSLSPSYKGIKDSYIPQVDRLSFN